MAQLNLETLRNNFAEAVPHVKALGITLISFAPEAVVMRLPYRDDWLGDTERGVIHTGVVTTLIDSTCGLALLAKLAILESIATLDLRMDYLRPSLRDKDVLCRAECFRVTPQIAFLRATCWQDDETAPVAIAQGAFMRTGRGKSSSMIPT